jgi:uncharacterized repeat protein (TIGR03803 family)
MKTKVKSFCLILTLLSLATRLMGQTLTNLVTFNDGDGASPQAGLVLSGGTLYGTAYAGGSSNFGTVFSVNTNGNNFTNLYSFNGAIYNTNTSSYITTDGANPQGTLVLSGNMLYGTTYAGGSSDAGTVFTINTNGSNYAIVHSFTGGGNGANPEAGLVLSGNTLYGTTFLGGATGNGSIFRVNTDGGDFTNIYSLRGGTNGANPEAGLVLSGNTLYGTTFGPYFDQSSSFYGTVFSVNTSGGSFSNVYSFTGGNDGAYPEAGLVLSGSTLCGTASGGGDFGNGTVFEVSTNGSGFSSYLFYTNGANPQAGLLWLGNTLYGTAANGGSQGWGTVFAFNTIGGFTTLYTFSGGSDGASPETGLLLAGNTLYGTTQTDNYGSGFGTVFALTLSGLAIPLNIALAGSEVTLTWSNPAFSLQSSTNLAGVFTNVPGATSPYTNAVTGRQQFFRLLEN